MKKKILAIAIAGAMATPSAFAAVDTSGMQYTSASEGFYASVRARWDSGTGSKNGDSKIDGSSNRMGVRGSSDLGGGLEGFYQSELSVDLNDGGDVGVRVGHVGLRGGFGEVIVGSFWGNDYGWTFGSTDVANWASGNFAYGSNGSVGRNGRVSSALQYTTPDLGGFQGALRFNAQGEGAANNSNDLNAWNVAAKYDIQGFTVAAAYNVIVDGGLASAATDDADKRIATRPYTVPAGGLSFAGVTLPAGTVIPAQEFTVVEVGTPASGGDGEDTESWTVRLGYAQDNWYANGWYGQTDTGASNGETDFFSIAGGVSLDKVNLYAMYESADPDSGSETNDGVLGVQYNFSSQMRIWAEYALEDVAGGEDYVNIGLRHDF